MKHLKTLSALAFAFVLLVFLNSAASAQTAVTLSGQVTNDRGEPLPGQRLYLNGPTFAFASTDANGRYTFSVSAGTFGLEISNADYQNSSVHAPSRYDLQTGSFDVIQNTTLNLQLPFKKLSVHVQGSQGTAIANVVIGAEGPGASNLAIGSLPTGTVFASGYSQYSSNSGSVTNANGDVDLWLLPTPTDPMSCDMPPCSYTLIAYPPSGSPYPAASLGNVVLTQDSSATITLNPPVTLSGQVTDNDGDVLPGLTVGLSGYTGARTTTDASGRYAISISAGNYGFSVDNFPNIIGPHTSSSYYVSSPPFALTQNMTLDLALPFQRVNVHVVDANDQPIAGAVVATNANEPYADRMTIGGISFRGASYYMYSPYGGGGVTTDGNGNATLWLFPVSDPASRGYTITAYPPGETGLPPMTLVSVFVTGETNVTIRPAQVTLSGRITDAGGTGLPNQNIALTSQIARGYGTTDSSGYYSISVSPGYYAVDISGGVPLSSPLHASQSYNLSTQYQYQPFALTQSMTVDLRLPFQRVNVHAVDANDQPVAGATVGTYLRTADVVSFGGVTLWGTSSYTYDPVTYEMLKTDSNGNATLWLLPAGELTAGYDIGANAPLETGLGYADLRPVFVTGETNVTLRFAGALPTKAPVISSISPTSAEAASPSFTLVVTGTDFIKTSVVRWNGADRSTTFVSNTQLTAVIPSTDIASPGTANVTVWTPAPGGGESGSLPFTIYTVFPAATLRVYAAVHTVGPGGTSGDQKAPLTLTLKIFDRNTFPSAELKDYATIWNSGPGLVAPWARITGPTATTFSNGPANLYIVLVPAAGSANTMTSGRYVVVGKVDGVETYVGAATDPLAVNSVTDEYLLVDQKPDGQIVPAVTTSGTPTPAAKATPTPKPSATPTVVPTSKVPKPTTTPKKSPAATPTAVPTKVSTATPPALPTQTPVPPATRTPKKQPTATPLATWTLPPTRTPHLTPTPRDKPTKR